MKQPLAAPALSLDAYFVHLFVSNQDRLTETELSLRLGIGHKSLWEGRQRLGIPRPSWEQA